MRNIFNDATTLTYRAYARTGLDADVLLEQIAERLSKQAGSEPKVEKRTIYVPVSFSELMDITPDSPRFTIDYHDQKCHVIREWKITFEGIMTELPIEKGLTSYVIKSLVEIPESEPI
jgi:hypothetical protein